MKIKTCSKPLMKIWYQIVWRFDNH